MMGNLGCAISICGINNDETFCKHFIRMPVVQALFNNDSRFMTKKIDSRSSYVNLDYKAI